MFVTHRRPGPGEVVSPRDACPDTGPAPLSRGQARALLDERTTVRGPGTGRDLHEHRRSGLTRLGGAGAGPLALTARSRHEKTESASRCSKPFPDTTGDRRQQDSSRQNGEPGPASGLRLSCRTRESAVGEGGARRRAPSHRRGGADGVPRQPRPRTQNSLPAGSVMTTQETSP
ncbi:hypothetical protein GCM10010266_59650 [Streptomyces griseomycini]|nr:hypothetical protein GCM10010266_59650 [Streptomyces griseomycini]